MDHCESILKIGNVTRSNAVDFLVNHLHVVDDKSSFSRSLLRNRLETGDRIVFLFDGFDEIDDQCQEKAIQLMKVINEEKSIPLYVTFMSNSHARQTAIRIFPIGLYFGKLY